jgi:hypothetical protein
VACVEAEECSATFVQTMRAKVRRHLRKVNSLPLCERTLLLMHHYGDLSALAAALSRRTLTRRPMALSLEEPPSKASTSPDPGRSDQTHARGSIAVVPIHKALAVAGSRRHTEARLSCLAAVSLPGVSKKVRVALDWMLDLVFSKDIVQLPTLRSPTVSEAEEAPTRAIEVPPAGAAKSRS